MINSESPESRVLVFGHFRAQRIVGALLLLFAALLGGVVVADIAGWLDLAAVSKKGDLKIVLAGAAAIFGLVGAGFALHTDSLRIDLQQRLFRRRRGWWPAVRAWEGELSALQRIVVRRERRREGGSKSSGFTGDAWVAYLHIASGPRGGRGKFELGVWPDLAVAERAVREWAAKLGLRVEGLPDSLSPSSGAGSTTPRRREADKPGDSAAESSSLQPDPAWSAAGLEELLNAVPLRTISIVRDSATRVRIELPCDPRDGWRNTAKLLVMGPVFMAFLPFMAFIFWPSGELVSGPWPIARILIMGGAGLLIFAVAGLFFFAGLMMIASALHSCWGRECFILDAGLLHCEKRLFGRRIARRRPVALRSIRIVGGGRDAEGQAAVELIAGDREIQFVHYVGLPAKHWLRELLTLAARDARRPRT